jgi:NitT/TauT family transport system substrate-binding protein
MILKHWVPFARPVAALAVLVGIAVVFGNPKAAPTSGRERVRLAFFPNLTHAPALAGLARGAFQEALPAGVVVDPKAFNAGPEEMEALLAGEVDVGYVGPSPAINTYLKSGGKALRVLAGACSGGAGLVARKGTGIRSIADLDGKRLAVPQLGGTQDVSARRFLTRNGLATREKGGSVLLLPVKNADILGLFKRGELDAAWVPEPWTTRLLQETGATLVQDERGLWPEGRFTTTVIVARTKYLEAHPDRVEALLRAHVRMVDWLRRSPREGQLVANEELKRLTGKELPGSVLKEAWTRLEFTMDPGWSSIETLAQAASAAGYLPEGGTDIAGLLDRGPLARAQRAPRIARSGVGAP